METFDYYAQKGLGTNSWPVWMSTDYSNPARGSIHPGPRTDLPLGNPEWGCDLLIGSRRWSEGGVAWKTVSPALRQ
jgi:hypothetical protein